MQKQGKNVGIYSVCSANGYVIEAAFKRGLSDGSCVLIESTANQCDQNGGYTGMTPADFKKLFLRLLIVTDLTVTESSLEEIT